MSAKDIIRRCRFRPYLPGKGPTFELVMYATGRLDDRGQEYVAYRLNMGRACTLFEGSDYSPSPGWAIDSDASVACLMSFLTLKPGDTDDEYFAEYTPQQLDYCAKHAEMLSLASIDRFGEV